MRGKDDARGLKAGAVEETEPMRAIREELSEAGWEVRAEAWRDGGGTRVELACALFDARGFSEEVYALVSEKDAGSAEAWRDAFEAKLDQLCPSARRATRGSMSRTRRLMKSFAGPFAKAMGRLGLEEAGPIAEDAAAVSAVFDVADMKRLDALKGDPIAWEREVSRLGAARLMSALRAVGAAPGSRPPRRAAGERAESGSGLETHEAMAEVERLKSDPGKKTYGSFAEALDDLDARGDHLSS